MLLQIFFRNVRLNFRIAMMITLITNRNDITDDISRFFGVYFEDLASVCFQIVKAFTFMLKILAFAPSVSMSTSRVLNPFGDWLFSHYINSSEVRICCQL